MSNGQLFLMRGDFDFDKEMPRVKSEKFVVSGVTPLLLLALPLRQFLILREEIPCRHEIPPEG